MRKIGKITLAFILGTVFAFTLDVVAETLIDSGAVSYSNTATNETNVKGALDELFSAVGINQRLGTTGISSIGDGTITGAIKSVNDENNNLNSDIATWNTWKSITIDKLIDKNISLEYNFIYKYIEQEE